jgi:uncharacterized membrane protein
MLVITWIVTALLAAVYVASGVGKFLRSNGGLPRGVEVVVGVLEVLGALALVLPGLLGIAEWLIPTAAFAFVLLQVCAIVFHIRRGESKVLPVNVLLALLALFAGLAWSLWI